MQWPLLRCRDARANRSVALGTFHLYPGSRVVVARSKGEAFYDKDGMAHNTSSFAKKVQKNRDKKKQAKKQKGRK